MSHSNEKLDDLFKKTGGVCTYGGRSVKRSRYSQRDPSGWEVDHGQPLSRDGTNDGRNHRVACWACNRFKGNMTAKAWKYRIDTYYGGNCPRWYGGKPVKKHP